MRGDLDRQGVVLLTVGLLGSAAPVLALLHAETPIAEPQHVPGRKLFFVRKH